MVNELGRVWSIIVYPDSAPCDWKDILFSYHLTGAISPLHDADINGDNTEKKPHYHVILQFQGKKSTQQILSIANSLSTCICTKVESLQSMTRYLIHLDNPEKAQYNIADVDTFGGFDLESNLNISRYEVNKGVIAVIKYIRENDIHTYTDLVLALNNDGEGQLLDIVLNRNSYACNTILKDFRDLREKYIAK